MPGLPPIPPSRPPNALWLRLLPCDAPFAAGEMLPFERPAPFIDPPFIEPAPKPPELAPGENTDLLAPAASVPNSVSAVPVDADCAAGPDEKSKPEALDLPPPLPLVSLSKLEVRIRPFGDPGRPPSTTGARPSGEGTNCPKSNPLRTGEPGAETEDPGPASLTLRLHLSPTW